MRTRRQRAVRAETGVSRGATSPAEATCGPRGSQACVRPQRPLSCAPAFAAEGGRGGIGASRRESRGPFFVGPRPGGTQDEVQARVHLAGRLRARPEPAQQDEDRRLRDGADARPAAAVELRRQLDAPGGRLELGLLPPAGRALPRPCAQPTATSSCARCCCPTGRRIRRTAATPITDDPDAWFGFEQEYFLYKDGSPLGFPQEGFPAPQGEYYTGVGFKNVGDVARQIVDEHIDLCIEAGIAIEGVNAEVAKGQWEFQIFGKGAKRARRRALDRALPDAPPLRALRRRRQLPSEAARRRPRLERLRAAHQLLDQAHARDRRRGVLQPR